MKIISRNPDETGRAYALRVLKENITDTTLIPGTLLSENELAKSLGFQEFLYAKPLLNSPNQTLWRFFLNAEAACR